MKLRNWISAGSLAAVLALLAGVLFRAGPVAHAANVNSVQNASNDPGQSIGPQVAQDPDGNVHVVWVSGEGSRVIRYVKGIWNGNGYNFGQSFVLADVGDFGYANPAIAVAPNRVVMAAWSDGTVHIRGWDSRANAPGGGVADLGSGIQPSIAPDSSSRFHIAWSGNFQVQYCQWGGSNCQVRDAWSSEAEGSAAPDIAVDSNNGVHVVWGGIGQVVGYRARAANAGWGAIQNLASGVNGQIAADGQGSVHIVWSQNFDIHYCRRTLTSGCGDNHTISAANDLAPSIGATEGGRVLVVFRDTENRRIWYDSRENGAWTGTKELAAGPTNPDVTSRPYTDRMSAVWSLDFDIYLATITVGPQTGAPPPPPSGPAPVAPQPVGACSPTTATPANLPNRIYLPLVMKGGC